MEFTAYIVPATMVLTELVKRLTFIDKNYLPHIAVGLGTVMGAIYGVAYGGDLFQHIFLGGLFGASASGVYDVIIDPFKQR